jgi:hypothetical protein
MVLIGDDIGAQTTVKLASAGGIAGVITAGASLEDAVEKIPQDRCEINGRPRKAQAFFGRLNTKFVQRTSRATYSKKLARWDSRRNRCVADRFWKDITFFANKRAEFGDGRLRSSGSRSAVIVIHGGGSTRDRVTYIAPISELLGEAGIAWFSID